MRGSSATTIAGRTESGSCASARRFFSSIAASSLRERCCTIAQPMESPKTLMAVRNRSLECQTQCISGPPICCLQKPIDRIDRLHIPRRQAKCVENDDHCDQTRLWNTGGAHGCQRGRQTEDRRVHAQDACSLFGSTYLVTTIFTKFSEMPFSWAM